VNVRQEIICNQEIHAKLLVLLHFIKTLPLQEFVLPVIQLGKIINLLKKFPFLKF